MKRILSLVLAASAAACSSAQMNLENSILTVELLDGQATDSIKAVQYFDGLGRLEESVTGGASPVGSYLHNRNVYDALGREIQEWLPVASGTINMLGKQTFINESYSWYADSISCINKRYDGLGRVVEYNRPGTAWKDRPQVTAYTTNAGNEVKRYAVEGDVPVLKGYYPSGTLSLTTTFDEELKTVSIYRDLLGNTILERRADSLDTYYVYDELGRLRFVLPPMYQEDPDLDLFAYRYTYDTEGRMVTSKLPGCQPVQYWYDARDRVTRMQDGELSSQGRYRVYGYDALGRLTSQSIAFANGSIEHDEVVNHYDTYAFLDLYTAVTDSGTVSSHLRGNPNNSTGKLTGTVQRASNGETLLATYAYDPFGRISRTGMVSLGGHLTVCDFDYNFVGDITHERYREYGLSGGMYGRTLNAHIEKNYDHPHTKLPSSSVITLHNPISGASASDTIMNLAYDNFGRVTANDRGGSSADMNYTYDLLQGWVKEISSTGGFQQKLYREDNPGNPLYNGSISAMTWQVPGSSYVRRYDYTYDGMNRLTEGAYSHLPRMNPWILLSVGEDPLALGESEGQASPLELIPVTGGDLIGPGNINAAGRYSERIRYDKNSNVSGVSRYGMNNMRSYGVIDSLEITRNGNQFVAIEDHAEKDLTYTGASDFVDGTDLSEEYTYDGNGRLTKDTNRGIGTITYDQSNNPRAITFTGTNGIEYVYAPEGTKLRTVHKVSGIGGSVTRDTTDYLGNLVMKNGHLGMYRFDGGYVSFSNDTIDGWHFYIQDYMGNNRMVVNSDSTVEQITHYYPYGGVIGDISTNENVQKYKFEGKELDRTFGLDNYDIHARQYFAMAPMWDRIDPLAEKYYGISPYAYCGGDPVNKVDMDGNVPTVVIGAVIGGVWKGAEAAYNGKNWEQVASAALGGAIDGAITASGGKIVGSIIKGAIGGSVGDLVTQFVDCCTENQQYIDFGEVGQSGVEGAITGFIVGLASTATPEIPTPEFNKSKELYQTKDQIRKFRDKAKDMTGSNNPKVINNKGKRLRESEAKNDFKKANEQYQRDTDEKDLINIIPQSYIGITLDLFYESLFEDN